MDQNGKPLQNQTEQVLLAQDIVKEFAGVRVLDHVNFELRRGEVHALLGENGAGKSTLMKILSGVYTKTSGRLVINGKEADPKSRTDAEKAGVGIVFQEFSQVKGLSVAENMHLNNYPKTAGFPRRIDWKRMAETTKERFSRFHIEIDPLAKVGTLGIAKQQIVEIVKALLGNTSILIMDEPTAALTENEIEMVFDFIRKLKQNGISIIYISHRLDEIAEICDRATILRDGKNVKTVDAKTTTKDEMIALMLGRQMSDLYPPRRKCDFSAEDVVLEAEGLTLPGKFENISFRLRKGEIIGFTGLVGAGKTEICQTIYGLAHNHAGSLKLQGKKIHHRTPRQAKRSGIALLPENRKEQGVVTQLTAIENIGLANLQRFQNKYKKINIKMEKDICDSYFQELDIRPADPFKQVLYFSGGNQQKIVIAKWLCSNSDIIIFDEPTRGIDVGAKVEIYRIIRSLADSGKSIIIASSETQEVLGMSDSIYVLANGKIIKEYEGGEVGLVELTNVVNTVRV